MLDLKIGKELIWFNEFDMSIVVEYLFVIAPGELYLHNINIV
jgi:hypothetical protein